MLFTLLLVFHSAEQTDIKKSSTDLRHLTSNGLIHQVGLLGYSLVTLTHLKATDNVSLYVVSLHNSSH